MVLSSIMITPLELIVLSGSESACMSESAAGAALSDEPLTPEQQYDQECVNHLNPLSLKSRHSLTVLFCSSHLLALSLAEEDKQFNERAAKWEKFKAGGEGGSHSPMSE